MTSSPIIADGTVYIGNAVDGKVHALNAFQGTAKWIYDAGAAPTCWSAALVSTDKVFIASDPGCTSAADGSFLYVLKANPGSSSGELIQKILLGPSPCSSLVPPPIRFGGTVYVASGNEIWGFDAETLVPVWPSPIMIPDDPITGTKFMFSARLSRKIPSLSEPQGVAIRAKRSLCLTGPLARRSGPLLCLYPLPSPAPSTANRLVYVRSGGGGQSGDLIAFDEQTGAEVWRSSVGTGFDRAIPAIAAGTVYVASGFNTQAFDAVSGAPIWPTPVPAVPAGTCSFAATIAYS